jgi:hypothetical protein
VADIFVNHFLVGSPRMMITHSEMTNQNINHL